MFDPFFHFSLPNSLGSLRNVPLVYGISVSGQTLPNLPGRGPTLALASPGEVGVPRPV